MYKLIDGDYFESLSDYSFGDMYSPNPTTPTFDIVKSTFEKVECPIFFIETHRILDLFNVISSFQDRNCKLIAHNSDATFGRNILNYIPKNVVRFWCQNYDYIETDIVKSLPIGLERKRWFPEQRKQDVLLEMINSPIQKDNLVYMNFEVKTNPFRRDVYETLKNKDYITTEMIGNGGDYMNYLENIKKHKFIISPPGNGIDCHRNWESIYLGCIPIVLDSHFVRNVYGESVLIVKNYSEIDSIDLDETYNKKQDISILSKYIDIHEKN